MNAPAAQAFARLTVAYERLCRAAHECDAARKGRDASHPVVNVADQMVMDAEMFDLDHIIKQATALACMAHNRARQIEDITKRVREVQP
jgi:hypothetical protein